MPLGFAGSLSHEFEYTTVRRLRDPNLGNLPDTFITDERARIVIRRVSKLINILTDQWFVPLRLREKVDGRHTSIFHLDNMVPILALKALSIGKAGLALVDLPEFAYQVKQRWVAMLGIRTQMTNIPHFLILDGVFGWLENDFPCPSCTTVGALGSVGSDTITLAGTISVKAGDVLLIGDNPDPCAPNFAFPYIVDIADLATPKVLGEPLKRVVSIGEKVCRYGRVPELIEYATMLLVRDRACAIGNIDPDAPPGGIGTRLNGESVEGYSYNLSPLPAINAPGGGARTSGNAEVDDILQMFVEMVPQYLGAV